MSTQLPSAGGADHELARKIHAWWLEAATKAGVNLDGFDPEAPLSVRLAWALAASLQIALAYIRFSSKMQHSDEDQLRAIVVHAAQSGTYVVPEYACIDRAKSGRQLRRDGLERLKYILTNRLATVLMVFTLSRLFRRSCDAFKFIQEEVVDAGLRAVAVAQAIDTADQRSWKLKSQIHGIVDEMLLEAIADHCREGLRGLFLKGWVTGALGVGYRPKVLPDAPLTKRGLPRTVPEIDPKADELIRAHAHLHLDGMLLKEGWRRWLAAGGPYDPRSSTGRMSYNSYRLLWSNIRLTGRWEFGRKRNQFYTKLDYVKQIQQPDKEIATFLCEELRILDDATFLALQVWLDGHKPGPRGPRSQKQVQLWDLVTEMFYCAHCSQTEAPIRFYQTGAHGKGMQCKKGDDCPCKSAVRREEAVRAICVKIVELLSRDVDLVEQTICRSCELDAHGDEHLRRELETAENKVRTQTNRIEDLYEMLGHGSEDQRRELRARIRAAETARSLEQVEVVQLKKALEGLAATLTPEEVREKLSASSTLLLDAAEGKLSEDDVYRALSVFRRVTGGQIMVYVERRAGRKHSNVRGVFRPRLIAAVHEHAEHDSRAPAPAWEEVSVWLRKPPRLDAIAERVHILIDIEKLSFRDAAIKLQAEGIDVNSGNCWYSFRRWYQMQGLEVPARPYNNGHERKSE